MNELRVFNNPQFGEVRTMGTSSDPLFCAADICRALGYTNPRQAVAQHCEEDDVTKRDTIDNLGRNQVVTYVTESGMYALIFGSRLESARRFKHWVTSEVLPAIRKNGQYTGENISRKDLAILIIKSEEEREALERKINADHPKVVFADAIVGSKSSCLIAELAKMITQNGYEIGQNRLFQWMRDNHYLGTTGEYYNIPCQRYLEQGLFELKKHVHSEDGKMVTTVTPKVTGKGQQYFINKFLAS